MDVPAPRAGTVLSVAVKKGDKVSAGDLVLMLEAAEDRRQPRPPWRRRRGAAAARGRRRDVRRRRLARPAAAAAATPAAALTPPAGKRLAVIGAGPGGYTAAFRAADLGLEVTLDRALADARRRVLERRLHSVEGAAACGARHRGSAATWARTASRSASRRSTRRSCATGRAAWFASSRAASTRWRSSARCASCAARARFASPHSARGRARRRARARRLRSMHHRGRQRADGAAGAAERSAHHRFDGRARARRAAGAHARHRRRHHRPRDGHGLRRARREGVRRRAHEDADSGLRSRSRASRSRSESPRATKPSCSARASRRWKRARTGITVHFEGEQAPNEPQTYGLVLVAVGRSANGRKIAAEKAGVEVSERGLITVDKQQRTNVPHIFAIGDIVGAADARAQSEPRRQGRGRGRGRARRASSTRASCRRSRTRIPRSRGSGSPRTKRRRAASLTRRAAFPWAASARSLTLGRAEGLTKLLFDAGTKRLLGAGIVGVNAGDLIAEAALAIEMGSRRGRHRPHRASAPDVVRDFGVRGRSSRRHDHGSLRAEEAALSTGPPSNGKHDEWLTRAGDAGFSVFITGELPSHALGACSR